MLSVLSIGGLIACDIAVVHLSSKRDYTFSLSPKGIYTFSVLVLTLRQGICQVSRAATRVSKTEVNQIKKLIH